MHTVKYQQISVSLFPLVLLLPLKPPQAVMQFAEDGLYVVDVSASELDIKSEQRKRSDDKSVGNGPLLESE